MRLSKRLMMSAQMVTPGSRVADVGCDHAHTSIWLIQNGIAVSCIAMDLREGPLEHAKENIAMCGMSDRIETRLSDGLDALNPEESDCILITGMGGRLTTDILQRGRETVERASELILQPQSDMGSVRAHILGNGFDIVEEACCVDYGKFYLSIHARRGKPRKPYSEAELAYGRILTAEKDKIYSDYLAHESGKHKKVLESFENTGEKLPESLERYRMEYELLKETLERFR